jgi:hypothetical protein
MTTKSEWQTVNQALMADDRRRLGEPPAAEEVLAYMRGELSAEEAARVRERLVCYPDLVRTLTGSFPVEGAQPGDEDYLSDREFASHWAALERRMKRGRVVQFWPVFGAIAATLAIVFGGLFWQTRKELMTPRVMDAVLLMRDGQRGPGGEAATTLTGRGEFVPLIVSTSDQTSFEQFRLEIVDATKPQQALWSSPVLARSRDDLLAIVVPRKYLKPGKVQVILYGVSGARDEPVASYTLRVP